MNQKSRQFKAYLLGDWRIENPTLQSFIRFEKNGLTKYYINRYSYEFDSLIQYGNWKLIQIKEQGLIDTFLVEIDKHPQKTAFKFVVINKNSVKVIDDRGITFFTRLDDY